MSGKSIISNSYLEDIADAIRYKKGTEETFYPSQMGDAIRSIEGIVPTGTMEIDANGVYDVTEKAEVDVDVNPDLRPLSVSENGSYSPDGFDGFSEVEVSVEGQWIDYDNVPVTLPEEYQRVEYIESNGRQFIELPIGFYPTDTIHLKGANRQSGENDKYLVTSKVWNNDANRFGLLGNNYFLSSYGAVFCFGNIPTNESAYSPVVELDGEFHKVSYKNRVSIIDNLAGAVAFCGVYFGSETANLKLFYGYNSNTAGKICYYIHEKADGRKLVLYACYRKSDGVIGMYDVENDVFYTNDGSGDFAKGADI